MEDAWDIAIVGAGAAGLAAGIFAGQTGAGRRIVLLDGARTLGAKILVSGGGRCNVTNERVRPEDFNGTRTIVRNVLAGFGQSRTVEWFESLGVMLKREETGKLFPESDSARSVLEALLQRCEAVGGSIRSEHRVTGIRKEGEGFVVEHSQGAILARKVILATGGKSLPKTGSDGSGWNLARRLGHGVTETYPALVPLVLEEGFFHPQVSGLSHEAELSVFVDGKRVDRRSGSLLWTHFGISGPVALDASRHWVIPQARGQKAEMRCGFLVGESFESAERKWMELAGSRPRMLVSNALGEWMPSRLADVLLRHAGIEGEVSCGQLSREGRRALIHTLTALPLPVARDRGWNYAEVTAGGVPLEEIDFRTMQSRCVPGLYLVGEILDCDGRIGGFNFQWAWATGYLAGMAAGR